MLPGGPPIIKRPVFLACEGGSEQGYGRWLDRLAKTNRIPVAIEAEDIGGGDPLELVEKSIDRLGQMERYRGRFPSRGLLLDRDRYGHDEERDEKASTLAREKHFTLIWQRPCHEAFLIRHFPGYEDFNPPDEPTIWATLGIIWPYYTKGMDAYGYDAKLGRENLVSVRQVERELDRFLAEAGWV